MMILFLFALYLISGPAYCSDVIAYSEGAVCIISSMKWYSSDNKYICKVNEEGCADIIRVDTKRHQVQDGRFKLYSNTGDLFVVLIRKLKPTDAGTYIFGLGKQENTTINLKVFNNASCGVPKIMNAHPGQNITMTCNYPEAYESNYKYVTSVNYDISIKNIGNTDTRLPNDRYSITDDKSAKVLRLNVSNVTETDERYYFFGIWNRSGKLGYYSYFGEILLHVTGHDTNIQTTTTSTYMGTSAAPIGTPSAMWFSSSFFITNCVWVCVVLLLIGGFALIIYKLRTRDVTPIFRSEENKQCVSYCYTDTKSVYENIRVIPI